MTLTVNNGFADDDLVASTRAGDDDAFGILFHRYRDELVRYVARMVSGGPDQAEDCIQDVFASALQSLRASDRPVVFKPWIYRIAKNACIDRHRRGSRYSAVSLDTAELGARDESRLRSVEAGPEIVAEQRQTIASLRNAFDDLEDSHHEILVLREFEGKSYDTISNQMGLSPAAVQSALFRARRRLQSEYEEIASGKRCELVQSTLDEGASGVAGVRKKRKVLSHLRDCVPCRRHAGSLGMTDLLAESASKRRLRERVAALFPLPFLGSQKLATGAAVVALLVGGGVATKEAGIGPLAGNDSNSVVAAPATTAAGESRAHDRASSTRSDTRRARRKDSSSKRGSTRDAPSGGSGSETPTSAAQGSGSGSGAGSGSGSGNGSGSGSGSGSGGGLTDVTTPDLGSTVGGVQDQLGSVGQTIGGTGLPGSDTVGNTVGQVNDTVDNTLGGTVKQVDQTTGQLGL